MTRNKPFSLKNIAEGFSDFTLYLNRKLRGVMLELF